MLCCTVVKAGCKNTEKWLCIDDFPLAYCCGSREPCQTSSFPDDQLESLQLQSSCLLCQRLFLPGFRTSWNILLEIMAVLMLQQECKLIQQLLDSNKNWMISCRLCYCVTDFCCQCKENSNLKHIQLELFCMSSFLLLLSSACD